MAKQKATSTYTEILCILDRSGSMGPLQDDTIEGFNKFLADQKELKGKAKLTLVLFDHEYIMLHKGMELKNVPNLDRESYRPRGTTALLESTYTAVKSSLDKIKKMKKSSRPDRGVCLIITDGYENASAAEFTKERVAELISKAEKEANFEFIFIGSNIDAFAEAGGIGIGAHNTVTVTPTSAGLRASYIAATQSVSSFRDTGQTLNMTSAYTTALKSEEDKEKVKSNSPSISS